MSRRSRTGGKSPKQGRKRSAPKHRNAPNVTRNRGASIAGQETVVARLTRERDEALLRETANSEILRLISQSPGDLDLVFRTILEHATRICNANFGALLHFDGGGFRLGAEVGMPHELTEYLKGRGSYQPVPGSHLERVMRTKQVSHTAEYAAEGVASPPVTHGGARSTVDVPMLKDDELIGVLSIFRQEVRPFTDKQIELVQNFAAQAVIAIENTRLLNELRQRTTDLTESLEQQTATSEVLRVTSSSPGELKPVFDAILENAVRICDAKFGNLWLREGNKVRIVAIKGGSQEYRDYLFSEPLLEPDPQSAMGRTLSKEVVQIDDISNAPTYGQRMRIATIQIAKGRTLVAVPMLKDDQVIGVIAIYRQEVRSFTDKQIELLKNFANQAVIAIENTRLLNELRESLQQQTATADVLKVISRSTFDLQVVLNTLAESAARLCEAYDAAIWQPDGKRLLLLAHHGPIRVESLPLVRGTAAGRAFLDGQTVHITDLQSEAREYPESSENARRWGLHTILCVPLMREGVAIGTIALRRTEAQPFTERQVALLQTFADQAVIAIENVRLFEAEQERSRELTESLQQQTATADVLKVISRSTFDLKSVLNTLVESIARLCEADMAAIRRPKGSAFLHVASHGSPTEYDDYMQSHPIEPGRGTTAGRVLLEGKPVHIPDVQTDPEYTMGDISRKTGYHTILGLPLLREGNPIGVVILGRTMVRPFTEKQIELATTFADQAVIAIENVRLFEEIQDKSRQLEEASQHKSQFLANMSHELRTPLNAILGYTELMADGAYGEPSEKMLGVLKRLESNGKHLLGLINDVLDLSKIEAGQLELELSDYCIHDIAQTVRSTLEPLAADKKLTFKVEVRLELPPGRGDGRRLTQVLINLVGNAIKFTDVGEVAIKAEANNGSFYVSVRDTGPGISAADQAKLFREFQQADNAITRKKGGTGLGLAISKRIIEMHGGRIWVESQPGQGSTFAFTLPVVVERQAEPA
jgi:signal transduction histidine kinase